VALGWPPWKSSRRGHGTQDREEADDGAAAGSGVLLGGDLDAGQQPQVLVPGGAWQCAAPAGQAPVLVSCEVAPGFDFADLRLR